MTLGARIEAVLFAAGEPIEKKRLAALLGAPMDGIEAGLEELRGALDGRGLALAETADEVELRTAPGAAEAVKSLREGELSKDLGRAGLEALAVILYRGGATRTEIDWIRGVNSAGIVRSLMLRGLIERDGDPSDRRRFRYTATTDALAHLGIGSAKELPRFDELQLQTVAAAEAAARAEESDDSDS
jgi:segregation and condensation protein B